MIRETEPQRYTIGNIVGIMVMVLACVGMALYAIFGEDTGRIGRNWEFVAVIHAGFAVAGVCAAVKAIRSRRR